MSRLVVSFNYTLTDPDGEVLDESPDGESFSFLVGASQIIPGLEEELLKLKVGDKQNIIVQAQNAYGLRDDRLLVTFPRSEFPVEDVKVGDQFQSQQEEGGAPLTAVEVNESEVTLDGNHPLAGLDLTFDVEITAIREATAEELTHGHAHGPSGHHHH